MQLAVRGERGRAGSAKTQPREIAAHRAQVPDMHNNSAQILIVLDQLLAVLGLVHRINGC